MPRGTEDPAGVREPDGVVGGSVHDQKRPAKCADPLVQICGPDVLYEVAAEGEGLAADQERRLALGEDPVDECVVDVLDVRRLVRRADTRDRTYRLDRVGGCDYRRATEGVTDQEPDAPAALLHEPNRLDGVADLVRERAVSPVTLRVAESQVVEPQHADALAGELLADAARSY